MDEMQVDVDQVRLARRAFARAQCDDVVVPHLLCHGARLVDATSIGNIWGHLDYLTIWDVSISL